MTQYAFGSGTLVCKRTDVTGTPPCLIGTLQDVSLDFDRKIETLLGQYNMAVAAGGGEFKITGKTKFARLQATTINNLYLGQTLTANSMLEMTTGEAGTVASGSVIFTQFKETTGPLASLLGSVFGRDGLVLHGETEVKKRKDLVRRFQEDESVPFFVLSVKAGGTGLNLTAASHVIHFDRWWNPAVENQATDRAFRIGQNKNVLVHKFICRGTVEDKIDRLIESKQQLAGDFLSGGAEMVLTEMKDDELLKLVTLDLGAAMKEG